MALYAFDRVCHVTHLEQQVPSRRVSLRKASYCREGSSSAETPLRYRDLFTLRFIVKHAL